MYVAVIVVVSVVVVVVVVVSVVVVSVVVVVVDVVVGYSWKCFCIGQSILLLANLWGQALVSDLRKISK